MRERGRRRPWEGRPAAVLNRASASAAQPRAVLRRGALLTLDDVEFDPLALAQRLETLSLNCRVVHEAILLAVLGGDETKALLIIEPLYGTGRTHRPSPED